MADHIILAGVNVRLAHNLGGYPPKDKGEYTQFPCNRCHELVWLGERQMEAKLQDDVEVLCALCVVKLMDDDEDVVMRTMDAYEGPVL